MLVRTIVHACAACSARTSSGCSVSSAATASCSPRDPERSGLKSGVTRTTWRAVDEATSVTYDAEFVPDFWVPSIIGRRYAVKPSIASTLELFGNVEKTRS